MPLPDATALHLDMPIDWGTPPRAVQLALAEADPQHPLDGWAAWRDGLDAATRPDPARRARLLVAEAQLIGLSEDRSAATWPEIQRLQAVVLGRPAPFRTGEVFTPHPRRYGLHPGLEARLARRLEAFEANPLHPLLQAGRLYLELIHVHPFADGNGRAARLWFTHTLRREGWAVPDLAALARLPKEPGRPLRAWAFVARAARLLHPRPHPWQHGPSGGEHGHE